MVLFLYVYNLVVYLSVCLQLIYVKTGKTIRLNDPDLICPQGMFNNSQSLVKFLQFELNVLGPIS